LWHTLTKDTSRISIPMPSCPLPHPVLKNPHPSSSGSPPEPALAPTPIPAPTPHAYVPTLLGDKRTSFAHPGDASLAFLTSTAACTSWRLCAPFWTAPTTTQPNGHTCDALHPCSGITPLSTRTHAYGAVDHTRMTRTSSLPPPTLVVCDGSRGGRRGGVGGMRALRCRCCPAQRGTLAVGYWVNRKSDWFPNGQGLRVGKMRVCIFVALLSPSGPH